MMALEVTEPAIRLFGRMIQAQRAPNNDVLALCYSAASVSSSSSSSSDNKTPGDLRELKKGNYLSTLAPNPDNPDNCEEEGLNLNKRLKKQSKVLLACPRCKSGATKFCYFNNYNTKQPRHFCRGCQRYWTAGGSMRSMAVGAGRRKLKKSASLSSWPEAKTISASVCGFFQVPVYAATAVAPYWAWVSPVKELSSSVWAPKTVRFDDASDVAKSSFWSTLGI